MPAGKHISNICEKLFFDYSVKTWLTSLNRVKQRFSKFTFKKSRVENYSVKSRLKSQKLQNLGFTWLKHGFFFVRVGTYLFSITPSFPMSN